MVPRKCLDCFFMKVGRCTAKGKNIDILSRPEWCPVRPIPKKKEVSKWSVSSYDGRMYEDDPYVFGWNACIDAILEGGGSNE